MAGMALSRFGLMPQQFYDLTPKEFELALDDYDEAEERREKFELEKMRLQTLYLVNVHIKDKVTDLRKFMPFEWDKYEVYVPTDADWKHFDELVKSWQVKQSPN